MNADIKTSVGVAAVMFLLESCAARMVKTETLGDPRSPGRVLIAYDYSEFKADVAQRAGAVLAGAGLSVTMTDAGRLAEESPDSYGAVVLLAPVHMWQLDGNVRDFMARASDRKRIILVTTAGGSGYKADIKEVDAITEASVLRDADALARTLVGKVKALLAGGGP
jgi:hypothetical protein